MGTSPASSCVSPEAQSIGACPPNCSVAHPKCSLCRRRSCRRGGSGVAMAWNPRGLSPPRGSAARHILAFWGLAPRPRGAGRDCRRQRGRRTAPRTVSGLVPRRQARPSQKAWVDALLQSGLLCTLAYIIGVIRVLSLVVCTPQQTAVSIREGLSRKKLVYPQNRTNGNGPGG